MKGKFLDRGFQSLLESKAVFEVARAIHDGMEDASPGLPTQKDINESLTEKKSQPTLSLILSLLEKYHVVEVKTEKKIKYYSISKQAILDLFIQSLIGETATDKDQEVARIMRENDLFKKDFFHFFEKRFHENYISSFSSYFSFFRVFYLSAYFWELEPFMMIMMDSNAFKKLESETKKDPNKVKLLELWKICEYIGYGENPDEKEFKISEFPSYSKIKGDTKKWLETWR